GEQVRPVIEAGIAASGGRFCGVRNLIAWHAAPGLRRARNRPPDLIKEASFRRGLGCLQEYDLSFHAYVDHPQLPQLSDLARAVPGVRIIVDHTGGPAGVGPYAGKRDDVFASWEKHILALAECPNVFIKLGGLGLPVMGFGFNGREPPASSHEL